MCGTDSPENVNHRANRLVVQRKVGMEMNGINYSTLLSNTGLFSNQTNKDETGVSFSGVDRKAARRAAKTVSADDTRQTNADKDTYEYSGQTRGMTAVYSRPKGAESTGYKALDANGIQEGINLSDAAKSLLAELRDKYQNMDISVAEWSSDEEQDYYAGKSSKDFSVLINPELLEKMAADESVRKEYEGIIGGAGGQLDSLKEQLGEDAAKIESFSVTLDKDGKASYAVKLLRDMTEANKADAEKQQEGIREKRAEKKKADEDRLERVMEKKKETEKVEAGSIDELVKAIRERLYPAQAQAATEGEM